jgi:hypothetical protein
VEGDGARAKAGIPLGLPCRHLSWAVVVGAWQVILSGDALLRLVVGPLAAVGVLGAVFGWSGGVVCGLRWVAAQKVRYVAPDSIYH